MSRNEKLKKLGNAIKEWRGAYNPNAKKWIRPPNPAAVERICKWCFELKLDHLEVLKTCKQFASYIEFEAWIKNL